MSSNASLTNPPASVVLTGYSENTTWVWQQNLFNNLYYNGTNYPQMKLTDSGVLTVISAFDSSLSNITLDPGNQTISLFNNIGGTSVNITHSGSTLVFNSSGITFGSSTLGWGRGYRSGQQIVSHRRLGPWPSWGAMSFRVEIMA